MHGSKSLLLFSFSKFVTSSSIFRKLQIWEFHETRLKKASGIVFYIYKQCWKPQGFGEFRQEKFLGLTEI